MAAFLSALMLLEIRGTFVADETVDRSIRGDCHRGADCPELELRERRRCRQTAAGRQLEAGEVRSVRRAGRGASWQLRYRQVDVRRTGRDVCASHEVRWRA